MVKFILLEVPGMNIRKSVHPFHKIPYCFNCKEDTAAAEFAVNERFFYGDDLDEELEKATYGKLSDKAPTTETVARPRPMAVAHERVLYVPEFLSNTMRMTLDSFVRSQKGFNATN